MAPKPPNKPDPKARKRARMQNARQIATQTAGKAFGAGQIDVQKFVKAREFEIDALHDGLKAAKKWASTRAFQEVPRDMRRRTASHNAKRVPKRLRARAVREMKDDNTPTVTARRRKMDAQHRLRAEIAKMKTKGRRGGGAGGGGGDGDADGAAELADTPADGDVVMDGAEPEDTKAKSKPKKKATGPKSAVLKFPDQPPAKFRKRQQHKVWLPTHIFHAKRARMTPPSDPLWGFSLPLTPSAKSYRATHRASTADGGAICWDASYVGTIEVSGPEAAMMGVFKAVGVPDSMTGTGSNAQCYESDEKNPRNTRWKAGATVWGGWLMSRRSGGGSKSAPVAPVEIVWKGRDKADKSGRRTAFVRVHPAAFLAVWELINAAAGAAKPAAAVAVYDVRYEIGSIEVAGPGALEALCRVLRPWREGVDSKTTSALDDVWTCQDRVKVPAGRGLPPRAIVGFDAIDPRLHLPPRGPVKALPKPDLGAVTEVTVDKAVRPHGIFDHRIRKAAASSMLSQQKIDRRRSRAEPGAEVAIEPDSDSRIPVLVVASARLAGMWTVLLPWKIVDVVWRSLVQLRLRSGQTVRFGGVEERDQVSFEHGVPSFPNDFPGTPAGDAAAVRDRMRRWDEWQRRPPGKRIEWESVDLRNGEGRGEVGAGWACDWDLFAESGPTPLTVQHVPSDDARLDIQVMSFQHQPSGHRLGVATVKIKLVGRGMPHPCDRIYRLPTDPDLRARWTALLSTSKTNPARRVDDDTESDYPVVPGQADLIGFVTSGNYNLNEGAGTGIGSIVLAKILEGRPGPELDVCIVRPAGQAVGRLARWTIV